MKKNKCRSGSYICDAMAKADCKEEKRWSFQILVLSQLAAPIKK